MYCRLDVYLHVDKSVINETRDLDSLQPKATSKESPASMSLAKKKNEILFHEV